MIQSGWVGDVAGLFFFSRQNYFQYALMRWVQTTPSFLFFDRPCLRHRVLHNGSFCQLPDGKPMARMSIMGYSARSACRCSSISLLGDTMLINHLIMQISKYIRLGDTLETIHLSFSLRGIIGLMAFSLFHTRA